MRNDRKKRDTERARERERDSSPAKEDEREMKIGEGGRGGQKKCKLKLHIEREEAPFSSAPPIILLFFLSAGHAWNEEREWVKADERKERRERAKPSVSYLRRSSHLFLSLS